MMWEYPYSKVVPVVNNLSLIYSFSVPITDA
jgi:hypothetical protein